MATEPSRRTSGGTTPDLEPEERRSWFSHGLAALAISALGLAVAGSVVLTTNAQTTAVVPPQTTLDQTGPQTARQPGNLPGQPPGATREPAAADLPALAAFTRGTADKSDESRTSLRQAVVEERAAQRSEDLTRSAEDIAAAALKAGSDARKAELAKADRARRVAAVKIAQERTRKAIQARVTAQVKREFAEKLARELAEKRRKEAEANNNNNNGGNNSNGNGGNNSNNSNNNSNGGNNSNNGDDNSNGGNTSDSAPDRPDRSDSRDVPSGGGSASPVPGAIVGASFGATGAWARYHTGLDFRAGYGTPIRAVTSGVVTYAGNKGNWAGNHVAIRHSGGYGTLSAHMQTISVSDGESVRAGQVIGYVGSTGRSFGAHLHFEVYPPGVSPGDVYRAINPLPWLRNRGVNTN